MKIRPEDFRIRPGAKVRLDRLPTDVPRLYASKKERDALLARHVEALRERQSLLYADDRFALLLIFQAMDAAGKDGVIDHVMSGVNPQGCQVHSFKHPSAEEIDHDFLWRTTRALPERGRIGIFNRSYYEETLIVRVHPEILRAERVPGADPDKDSFWRRRFRSIRDLERHLVRNGTRVVKFFLHLSAEEQRKRFLARIDDPRKNWKFGAADVAERAHWADYMRAYEECLRATSTADAPWYAVPADDKGNARLIVSRVVLEALESLPLRYPRASAARRQELKEARKLLARPAEVAQD
jgi:PPK2 family polyphosphate:nucleotide phosphotransferase